MDIGRNEEIEAVQEVDDDDLRRAVIARLVEEGIAEVRIEFDSSCDEGQIEDITCTTVDGAPGLLGWPCGIAGKVTSGQDSKPFITRENTPTEECRPMTMHELLDEWSYELLNEVGLDWVNNDGGYGAIVITPGENSIRCEMNIRFVDAEYSEHEL